MIQANIAIINKIKVNFNNQRIFLNFHKAKNNHHFKIIKEEKEDHEGKVDDQNAIKK